MRKWAVPCKDWRQENHTISYANEVFVLFNLTVRIVWRSFQVLMLSDVLKMFLKIITSFFLYLLEQYNT